jgi:hypothetical protein
MYAAWWYRVCCSFTLVCFGHSFLFPALVSAGNFFTPNVWHSDAPGLQDWQSFVAASVAFVKRDGHSRLEDVNWWLVLAILASVGANFFFLWAFLDDKGRCAV